MVLMALNYLIISNCNMDCVFNLMYIHCGFMHALWRHVVNLCQPMLVVYFPAWSNVCCACQVKDGSLVNDMSLSVTGLASRVSIHLTTHHLQIFVYSLSFLSPSHLTDNI